MSVGQWEIKMPVLFFPEGEEGSIAFPQTAAARPLLLVGKDVRC